jgi:hypothetical protein
MARPGAGSYGDSVAGGGANEPREYEQYASDTQDPQTLRRSFELTRRWAERYWYVAPTVGIRAGFIGFKPRVRVPSDLPDPDREDAVDAGRRIVQQTIREWLTIDVLIATWRANVPGRVTFLRPEDVEYRDEGGIEVLTTQTQLSSAILQSLPEPVRRRYQ